MKMSEATFDSISEGKLSGFVATMTGRIGINGSLFTITKFDDRVIKRFVADDAYLEAAKK